MTALPRVRFAPSPTGQVHIGNIRAAIFNYLFARHAGGAFLLRVEDTDRVRSTPEAIDGLMGVLDWMALNPDEAPLFQSSRLEAHLEAAEQLIGAGHAYRHAREGDAQAAIFFRMPVDAASAGGAYRVAGEVTLELFEGETLQVDATGIQYVGVSRKGKPDPGSCCLAGMADGKVLSADGSVLLDLQAEMPALLSGERVFASAEARRIVFTRREIVFRDLVKGELAKALDSMKDLVIVRGDGSPVFHLANVCDDAFQGVTHIIRGDDHVENTYRHLPLFWALGQAVPVYAHLPMIVNEQGKPYSKRDGDAFVGDFREKGYLPEALFNYLTLLGWSPGDDREKMNRDELIAEFTLERVQRAPAQMDLRKLANLNGKYLQDLPETVYLADVRDLLSRVEWGAALEDDRLTAVALLMRPRLQTYADVFSWRYFADNDFERDEKALKRGLGKAWQREALLRLAAWLAQGQTLGMARESVANDLEIEDAKLNLPLRVALTGQAGGPELDEVVALLDPDGLAERIHTTLSGQETPA